MIKIEIENFSPEERQIFFITQQFMSDDIKAYSSAMIKSRGEFKATGKDGSNEHQKYKYAKIDQIYDAVVPALTANGIMIDHFRFAISTNKELLVTRLTHAESGQFRQDSSWLEAEKPGNQARGSALTYMKKYAVLNLCGIAPEEDDDGVGSDKIHLSEDQFMDEPKKSFVMKEDGTPITPNQLNILQTKFKNIAVQQKYPTEFKKLAELTKAEASQLIGKLI